MNCIDKYLKDIAEKLAEDYHLLDEEDGVFVSEIFRVAEQKSDEIKEIIISNLYDILEENDIDIYE